MTAAGPTRFLASALLLVVVALVIAGTATPGWTKVDGTPVVRVGPWRSCLDSSCQDTTDLLSCSNSGLSDDAKSECNGAKATRAFTILSCLAAGVALALSAAAAFLGQAKLGLGAAIASLVTFITILLSWAIWAGTVYYVNGKSPPSGWSLDYAWILFIIADAAAIGATVCAFLFKVE